ncbi:uncharacterized protein DSM5745_11461 [Aspergillus mulundensis]|uniref:Uncharacterized protein n=1 Tax=Aspergillus mulundensis TaxID=1810919 RepID=A0A3D8Q6V5_9EURO|nr:Uncharacterized protein DSM5745_11461 [Aspergillus mulundensis]RDW57566.1 Uncharacterized protein DSM5745_11461 [Aspergillus mulundensis]
MSQPDPLSWTLLFKKHRTTVLLLLPPSQTIEATKTKLVEALRARGLKDINGDPIPEDPAEIEFGVAVDKNDLEKGWTSLEASDTEDDAPKRGAGKKAAALTLKVAEFNSGQSIAFRFRRKSDIGSNNPSDLELGDPGWDVVLPTFEDEDEGP